MRNEGRIKVIHLIHHLGPGGAENGIINLANHIDIRHFDTAICAFVGGGSQTHRLNCQRITLFEMGKRNGNDIRLPARLFRVFKQWKPDIVHTHAWGTLCEGIITARAAQVPVVVHGEHGTLQGKKINLFLQRRFWRIADMVLAVSTDHARRMSHHIGFPINCISVLANGVDTDRFGMHNKSFKERLGFTQDDLLIGTVGRLVAVKNQRLLIRSFAELCKRFRHLKLVITGDGPLRNELESQVKDLALDRCVHLLGRRSDVPLVMAAMDIFVLCSHSEGMSNTILEAMSSGLPVVATAVGGNPELVVHQKTGYLIPDDDVDALTASTESLIVDANLRERMGFAGRQRAVRQFSLRAMVERYETLYRNCLTRKPGYWKYS